jgi:hypothetical protein
MREINRKRMQEDSAERTYFSVRVQHRIEQFLRCTRKGSGRKAPVSKRELLFYTQTHKTNTQDSNTIKTETKDRFMIQTHKTGTQDRQRHTRQRNNKTGSNGSPTLNESPTYADVIVIMAAV